MTKYTGVTALAAALAFSVPTAARAQEAAPRSYNIPAQDLGQALRAFAASSGREVVAPGATVAGQRSGAAIGSLTPEQAMARLLAGTGFAFSQVDGAFVIRPIGEGGSETVAANDDPQIVVTGSRIAGAAVPSPVISIAREQARNAGQATLRDIVRAIPQNFGGGQNPGIGFNVPEGNGADVGGGSSINLRGLGSDATLTLLNGHRLSYNSAKQSIDISGIPLGAISRVDVMPDGASALFGSDAVAGVVNIVLRRDLDGLETSAQLGASTEGGNFAQLYGVTAGQVWGEGSALVAYEHGRTTAVTANQRYYAASRSPGLTMVPALRRHSLLGTLRQSLGSTFTFAIDGTFNKRWTDLIYPNDIGGPDLAVSRNRSFSSSESYGLAPSLEWIVGSGWEATLLGTYGRDKVDYAGETITGAQRTSIGSGYYVNRARSIEFSGSGPLLQLPGGDAKLAIGIGYRRIDFQRFTGPTGTQNIKQSQSDHYGFGELNLPLLSGAQNIPLLHSLTLSAAARYEDYRGIGDVTTPKVGLIYAPTSDVSLKASWGKSFRAPTLFQQHQPRTVYLTTATLLGGQGYPPTATTLLLLGGDPDLDPERSENWSATLDLHPRALEGASLEISYFSVRYQDRIVTPIPSLSQSLRNPGYAGFVTLNPSAAVQAAALASATTFANLTGGAEYDPANVVALVSDTSVNAGRQSIWGVDALARYTSAVGTGSLSASLNAAYLESEQQIGPTLPVTQLAGIIFNPPHLRLRGELSWTQGPLSVTGSVTRIGSVEDNRNAPTVRIDGMTPIDLTFRLRGEQGVLAGFDIVASVQNILNDEPSPIRTVLPYDTPYDSTNYSPFGRVVSLSVLKQW